MGRGSQRERPGTPNDPATMPRRRRRLVPALALGAMALGFSGLLLILPSVSSACQPVSSSTSASAVAAPGVSAERIAAAIEPGSRVLIVGDSYTSGRGSTSGIHGWAQDISEDRGWKAKIDDYPGTGYVDVGASGSSHFTFGPRIERDASFDPELVIVQGSQNDWLVDADTLRAAVERTLRTAQQTWPDAVVVAFGPSAPLPHAKTTVGVAASVSSAAATVGVPYIDALAGRWFTTTNSPGYSAPDGGHPNDAGHQYLADRVSEALDALATPADSARCA
ncbi:SGNH/GDSL hydrolase family protein [Curtobacterium flaccumfaciens pv. flaccumfaciens]|uniref:SGNH/GDSL hydrolase family protein n=1 Tax=Curtobacterium flaccumfaciens pv. flaccumfaciens TaxID=138532 RepID=A0A9Q2ZPK2_9MICO|nr:SGNH/GDSL hydrolase family protein [Curtobacterium flaccumfaciens]MBT1541357.1 SGNH/GDSL hydrolase family protein [Curtobacterium flaccumfaciens pv. flaccumfaciens]